MDRDYKFVPTLSYTVILLPVPYAGFIVDTRFIHRFVNLRNLSVCPEEFGTEIFAADSARCEAEPP